MASYRWSESAGRFTDAKTGRYVADSVVRRVVGQMADHASERLAAASQRILAGEMSLAAWQLEAMQAIKLSQVSAVVIAHGGAAAMTPSRYLEAARAIKAHYQYLRDFAEQISDGRQPLNGSLTARARQYGQGARAQFERIRGRGQQRRGYQSERNVIHSGETCSGCRAESARGWVPVGGLVPVGSRTCRGNCRCSISYRREAAEAA